MKDSKAQPWRVAREFEFYDTAIIESLPGRRAINEETVCRLMESIKSIGLRTPITVRIVDDFTCSDGEVADGVPILVTGAHRLEAIKRLGWDKVECILFESETTEFSTDGDDETTAKLWEISENLDRAELTPLERSELIAEWIILTEKKAAQVVSSQVGTKVGRPESGVNAAARELGISKTTAHRATKIAAIPEKAKQAARDAGLDRNQAALEKIAKADKPVDAVKAIISEPSKPKVDADEKRVGQWSKRDEETYAALLDAWSSATDRARREFVRHTCTDRGELQHRILDAMHALIAMGAADTVRSAVLYGAGLPEVKAGVHVPRKKAARKSSKAKPARGTMVRGTDPKTGEPMIGVRGMFL